jgi:hypothetical protein
MGVYFTAANERISARLVCPDYTTADMMKKKLSERGFVCGNTTPCDKHFTRDVEEVLTAVRIMNRLIG